MADSIATLKELLTSAKNVLIVTHERPTGDSIGSSLALALALKEMGKQVSVACPEPMTVELSSYVGVNTVTSEINKKNFVISLDYVEGSIEKVSYHIEGDKFNLVIEPREGFDPFSQDKVHFSQAGIQVDVIITVDTIHLGGLKGIYESDKVLFASKPIINIDRHPNNSNFGQLNLVNAQASSTAELVTKVITELGVTISADIATNLLNALYQATNNFMAATVTADSFEVAAMCVAKGGRRFRKNGTTTPSEEERPVEEAAQTQAPEAVQPPSTGTKEAPADWLKPKIFRSSNLG